MEQKRTLTGDEANGHDNSGSGIYHTFHSHNGRMRKKAKNRQPKAVKHDVIMLWNQCSPIERSTASQNSRISLIRPLRIPEIFVRKPPPPPKSFRTGKVWSRKRPHEMQKFNRRTVVRSRSDSHLVEQQPSTRPSNRRFSHIEQKSSNVEIKSFAKTSSQTNLHSSTSRFLKVSNFLACREFPCIHCLIEVGYVSYSTRSRLLSDRRLENVLNDFLYTSGFQHIIFS